MTIAIEGPPLSEVDFRSCAGFVEMKPETYRIVGRVFEPSDWIKPWQWLPSFITGHMYNCYAHGGQSSLTWGGGGGGGGCIKPGLVSSLKDILHPKTISKGVYRKYIKQCC